MDHWAAKYIGKAWDEREGFGPDRFHCWGLVWYVYREELGLDTPQFMGIGAREFQAVTRIMTAGTEDLATGPWVAVSEPREFTVVPVSQGSRAIHHVGLYLNVDGGRILHAYPGGVIAEPFVTFRRKYNRILFLNHHGLRH